MNDAPRPEGDPEDRHAPAPGDGPESAALIDDLVPTHGYAQVPLVALGGSAGSIEALQAFFGAMPPSTGLAFAVVIHLSPDHDSMLAEVLQRCTALRVVKVEQALAIEPDTVYVIPPRHVLHLQAGQLRLRPLVPAPGGRVVIDVLLRTLADSHGAHAAAVLLSGMGDDGALGLKRIKERGGLAIVQDPAEALHASMPQAAIRTGIVDWVLPVQAMPARLLAYFRLEQAVQLPPEEPPPAAIEDTKEVQLQHLLDFLRARTGRDFTRYKRATVLRRIGRRMQVNGVENLMAYLDCLRTRPGECQALVQDLMISVTTFFRDPECFAALEALVPSLFEGKGPHDTVRVWVVACATGEEAYSVAMLLAEHADTLQAPPLLQVFATDLDEHALRAGRAAVYPAAVEADVGAARLRRFFARAETGYRVRQELRDLVLFATHDVLADSPFSRLDLVTCRNLLIYLTREAQDRVLETVHFALNDQGRLFIGASETVEDRGNLFAVVDKKHRLYARRSLRRPVRPLPDAPSTLVAALQAQPLVRPAPVLPRPPLYRTMRAARGGGPPDRPGGFGELHLAVLERLAPPSLLVNADHDIVHLSPSAGRFLQLAGGEPSRNLLAAVQPDLRIDLRATLYRAAQQGAEAWLPPVPLSVSGGTVVAGLRVIPVDEGGEPLFLVLFEIQPGEGETAQAKQQRLAVDPLARHLDAEIERLKRHLRETVEDYEASVEKVRASNEELQAMNEELRAATEELETSREELQSINEELASVNAELRGKVDQLSSANSDLQNLMDATQIGTVFVDRNLCIKRFTPAAVRLFNLIAADVGRPLTDMATELHYPGLGDDAARVLQRLAPVEREVGQSGGSWYLARLLPYRTVDDRIAGIVFTFIDITERKRAEESEERLRLMVESAVEYAIFSTSLDRRITSWNRGAQRLLGYGCDEAIGQSADVIFTPEDRERGGPEEEARTARSEGRASDERMHLRKDGSRFPGSGTLMLMRNQSGEAVGFVKILRDLTRPQPEPRG